MFRIVPLSITRSFSLYTQQWFTRYVTQVCWQLARILVWHIPLLCVQRKTPDDGQRNCSKHVEFYSKNKFEKLVQLVGFIIRKIFVLILLAFTYLNMKPEGSFEMSVKFYRSLRCHIPGDSNV